MSRLIRTSRDFHCTQSTTKKTVVRVLFVVVAAISLLSILYPYTRSKHAYATANNTINFQARILTSGGSVVPDGSYNVRFKIYDGGTQGGPSGTGQANSGTGGSPLWTETWQNSASNGVVVKNGYITATLGSITSFPGTMPWDQELWITMDVGGTSGGGSPTYDGEMVMTGNTRMRITAVPYAYRAAEANVLKTVNGANVSTLGINAPTGGNQTFQLQDQGATGTYDLALLNGVSQTFSNVNTFSAAGTALQVTNNATIGGTLGVTGLTTATGGLSTGAGSTLTVGGATVNSTLAIGDIAGGGNIGTAATTVDIYSSFAIGQTTAGQTLTIPAPTSSTSGRIIYITNVGSAGYTMAGSVISPGISTAFMWNSTTSAWSLITSGTTGNYIQNGTTVQTANFNIQSNATTDVTATIQGANSQSANILEVKAASVGSPLFSVGNTGAITFQNSSDSANALTVKNAGGGTNVFNVNTTTPGAAVNGTFDTSGGQVHINTGGSGAVFIGNASIITSITGGITLSTGGANNVAITDGTDTYLQFVGATSTLNVGNNTVAAASTVIKGGSTGGIALNASTGSINLQSATNISNNLTVTNAGNIAFQRNTTDITATGAQTDLSLGTSGALYRFNNASALTINTLAGGVDGRIVTLVNAGSSTVTLVNNGTGTASNKIITGTGSDVVIPAGGSIELVYDSGASVWRVSSGAVAANGGYIKQVPVTTADNTITPATTGVVGLTVNGTNTGTAATALVVSQPGAAAGVTIASANNTATNGLSFSGTFTNLISASNFSVTNAGAVTAVGVNAGAGLLQGSLGLTVSGAAVSLNDSSNFATSINTGTSTGSVTIGNASNAANTVTIVAGATNGIALNAPKVTTNATTLDVFNATATTVNAFGAATAINIGAASSTVTFGNTGTSTLRGANNQAFTLQSQGTGAITVASGAASSTTGLVTIKSGNSSASASGDITLQTGTPANTATAGNFGSNSGSVNISTSVGGNGPSLFGIDGGGGNGGSISLQAGNGGNDTNANGVNGIGGSVSLTAGTGGFGGNVSITAGSTNSTYNDGFSTVPTAGNVTITAGDDTGNGTGSPGSITLQAGAGGSGTTGTINLNSATIATNKTSINLLNTTATTVNAFGAATTLSIGASSGTTTINNALTVAGNASLNGNTTIGNATTDRLTVTSQILGSSPLVFQGATDNGFTTTLAVTDPTANNTITFPDTSGTICLTTGNCSTAGSGYVLNQSSTPGSAQTGNINMSGTIIGATLQGSTQVQTPLLDTASAVALNIGTTNATSININQNTVLAAGKSVTITGGNTASRPASPTEGMLYYDTDTHQLIQYNGSKWVSDRSSNTKIVAPSSASQAIKDSADYVANGTSDQTVINNALTAAAGGTVLLLPGTYTTTGTILVPDNTTLAGSGANTTIVKLNVGSGSDNLVENSNTSTGSGVSLKDLMLDGSLGTGGTQNGIYLNGMTDHKGGATFTNLSIINWNHGNGMVADNGSYIHAFSNNNLYDSGTSSLSSVSLDHTSSIDSFTGNDTGDISLSNTSYIGVLSNNYGLNLSASGSGLSAATGNTFTGVTFASTSNVGTFSGNNSLDVSIQDSSIVTFGNNELQSLTLGNGGIETFTGNQITSTVDLNGGTGGNAHIETFAANKIYGTITLNAGTAGYASVANFNDNKVANVALTSGVSGGASMGVVTGNNMQQFTLVSLTSGGASVGTFNDNNAELISVDGSGGGSAGVSTIDGNNIGSIYLNTVPGPVEISGNIIVTASTNTIELVNADGVSITSNTFQNAVGAVNAINIDSASGNTYLAGNKLGGLAVVDASATTVYGGQLDASNNYVIQPAGVIDLNADTNISGALVVTGNGTFQGGIVTLGTTSQAGSVVVSAGNGFTGTLSTAALTSNRTYTLPDASGTFCLDSGNCSTAGSGYVLNQSSTPGSAQTGNINMSGTIIGATLQGSTQVQTPLLDTASVTALNIGTTNANQINLKQNTTVSGNLTVSSGVIQITGTTGNNSAVAINGNTIKSTTNTNQYGIQLQPSFDLTTVTGGTLTNLYSLINIPNVSTAGTVSNAYGQYARVDNTNAGASITNSYGLYIDSGTQTGTTTNKFGIVVNNITGGSGNVPLRLIGSSGNLLNITNAGVATFRTTTDQAGAFSVQSSGNTSIFSVDTSAQTVTVNGGFTSSGGAVSLNGSSNFNTTINTGTSTGSVTIGNASNAANTVTIVAGATNGIALNSSKIDSSAATLNLFNTPTTISALQAATSISLGATTGTLTVRNANTTIGNAAGSGVFTNNGATLNTEKTYTNFAAGGAIDTAANSVDKYTYFSILQTTASQTITIPTPTTNPTTVFGRIIYVSNIGTTAFTLGGTTLNPGTTATLIWSNTDGAATGGESWQFAGADGNGILNQSATDQNASFRISGTGSINGTSATAFRVQNASSADTMFTVDTTNNRVKVGNDTAAASANTTAFVLDSASTANQPAGVNGAMFYDTTKGHVQCYEGGAWGDCGNTTLQNAYNNSTGGTTPEVVLDNTRNGLDIQDRTAGSLGSSVALLAVRGVATATTLGASLFQVSNNSDSPLVGIGLGTQTPTTGIDMQFGGSANRTIQVLQNTTANLGGSSLTVQAGSANTAGNGGATYINGGAGTGTGATYSTGTIAQTANAITGTGTTWTAGMTGGTIIYSDGTSGVFTFLTATTGTSSVSKSVTAGASYTIRYQDGGSVFISGGASTGGGAQGLVGLSSTTFVAASATQSFASNGSLSSVDNFSTIVATATNPALVITVPAPSIAVVGRILYVSAANGSNDFALSLAGTSVQIAMKANSTATLIWNGTGWTAAGASSSTTLQAAYDNTLVSAGGAEILLNNSTAGGDGLTIRNNTGAKTITGALLEVQTSVGSNLFSVNNNATEYANNGGAETTTFTMWPTSPTGGSTATITRDTTVFATGIASTKIVTTGATTANQGVANTLTAALTANLQYTVSFAIKGTTSLSTLDVYYSKDGTNTSPISCSTGNTVTVSGWTRIGCTFTAPASGITSSNAIFIRQSNSNTVAATYYVDNLSVTVNASVNHAVDGSVDSALGTNWVAIGGSVARDTTTIFDTSGSLAATTGSAGRGVYNNLANGITPAINTQYRVSFYARGDGTNSATIAVNYSRDGGTTLTACQDYNTQTAVAATYTLITCYFTTDGTTPTAAQLRITQTGATPATFYVDSLNVTLNNNNASNVQIGGGSKGGPTTLLTLDRSSTAPIAANNDSYLGSMYYDTSTGRIQCYEADGWGACGSAPDNIVNLNPEYAGAVLNGGGVGTMTADLCANSGALSVNSTLCAAGQSLNFYRWTSPQATQQTYSIYVNYQLPSTFKSFASDNTVQLTGRVDSTTNAAVTYQMYVSHAGSITQCGTTETNVITTPAGGAGSANTWYTYGINGNESTGCPASGGDYIIFKINLKANSSANAYVSTLSFTTTGK